MTPTPLTDATPIWTRWIAGFGWRDFADLFVVWLVITSLLRIVRDTRTFQMLRGLGLLLLAAGITRYLSLPTATWMLQSLLVVFAIGLIIVLQPELRRLITTLGEQPFLKAFFPHSSAHVREITEAARFLSEQGWGGLIILERETSLVGFGESGVRIDADIKAELLGSIFTPGSPLHDGAAIVRVGRIYAAGCTLPLSEVKSQVTALGMRHRAAIGITEETDAVAIVVSEESRRIALAMRGQLTPPLDMATLEDMLMLHGQASGV